MPESSTLQDKRRLKILLVWPQTQGMDIPEAPPLGLLYLASALRKDYDVWVIDLNALKYTPELTKNRLLKEKPDILGTSSTALNYPDMIELCHLTKKILPDTKVVIGGPQVSYYPDKSLEESKADYVITGEAEVVMLEMLKDIQNSQTTKKKYIGKSIMDLDTIDMPAIDLIEPDITFYQGNLPRHRKPETIMMWSRGCPFNCIFCSDQIFNNQKQRFRCADMIVTEIKRLKDLGIKEIFVYDDDLVGISNSQKEWLMNVCDKIIAEGLNDIYYKCQGRCSKNVDLELLTKMKKAGFKTVMWGCESGSNKVLKKLRKGTTSEGIIETIQNCKKAGIEAWMFLIIGNISETVEDAALTEKMIMACQPDHVQVTFSTPYPSDYRTFCEENNLIIEPDVRKWNTNIPVVKPDAMSIEDVKYWRKRLLKAHEKMKNKRAITRENFLKKGVKIWNDLDYPAIRYVRRFIQLHKDYGFKFAVKRTKLKIKRDFI